MSESILLLPLSYYGKVAEDFCTDQGATMEHSQSYATEEQRGYGQKDQDLVCKNLVGVATAATDSLIADCGSCPDSANLSETRDSLVEVYYEESASLADSMSTVASEMKSLVQTAESDNGSITSSTTPGATEQWIRSVYYDSWFEHTDSIIDLHWDSLLSLSTACPMEQGQSVYIARTLLETKFDTLYSVGSCQGSVPKLTKSKEIKELDVYPNPTRSQLYIEGATPGKMAYIFNQLGRTVDKIEITGKKTQYNTDDLESGIYWIRTPNGVAKFIKR